MNRCLNVLPSWLDGLVRALGPTLVLAAWILFGGCAWAYFHSVLPVWDAVPTSGWALPITLFGLSLLFQVYYNHIMAWWTKPGGVPKDWVRASQQQQQQA